MGQNASTDMPRCFAATCDHPVWEGELSAARAKECRPVKAEINGVRGLFVLDTGASYVTIRPAFADRAKIPKTDAGEITLATANGQTKARLAKADKVTLGKLEATNLPVAVQKADDKSYGPGIDGLLGMSFLSRFDVQVAGGFIEVRTRQRK